MGTDDTDPTPRPSATSADRVAYLEALCRTVPYHIVRAVLDDPHERSVETQNFEGSILFADMVGYTALCERLATSGTEGLSRLSALLDKLFGSLLDEAVFPYDGFVIQFGGDSLTVVFRGEDHARRCVAAALSCQRLMYGERGRLLAGKSGELMLRIGLAMGPIRLGIVGDLYRRSVVTAGHTAHRVLRLQHLAQPNTIVADTAFGDALGADLEAIDRTDETLSVRGLRHWPESRPVPPLGDGLLTQVEEKIALLQPFVAEPLAQRLRSTPRGLRLDGELREVVVIFVELWGLDEVEGEGARAVSKNLARSLLRAYRKYGGTIVKVDLADRGHRALVVFGLHRPDPSDAERALLAALESTQRLKSFTAASGFDFGARTGVHMGQVYFGAIGSPNKHDITVVGDAVNIAARTVAVAEPFEVLATASVIERAGEEFEVSERGPIHVKGKSQPIRLGVIHAASHNRAHWAVARRRPRFFAGRDSQTQQLEKIVDASLRGEPGPGIVGVVGAPGTGKSAMMAPVIDRWVRGGGLAMVGRCRFATHSTPLAPIIAMFQNYLGLSDAENESDRRERIRAGLERFALPSNQEILALLQPVIRPDGTTEALLDLADAGARERVLSAIVAYFEQRSEEEPVLRILEDLHLADSLTLELARRLIGRPRSTRTLIISTYRPDAPVAPLRGGFDVEISLDNLSLHDATQLMRHELGAQHIDSELAVFLWQRSEGNPGELVELLRFLIDRQLVNVKGDAATVPEPGLSLLEDVVPADQARLALARLDDLGAVERRLLRTASAIGRRFGEPLLRRAVDSVEESALLTAVDTLSDHRVIVASPHESRGYMFRDSVTRAVTYGSIPEAERRDIHRRIADALESLPPEDRRRAPATLAMHRHRAAQFGEAARQYHRAASAALRAGLDQEVIDLLDRFDGALASTPESARPSSRRRANALLLRMVAAGRLGRASLTLRVGRQIITEYNAELDVTDRAMVDYWLGRALVSLGRPEKAQGRLERVFGAAIGEVQRADAARLLGRIAAYAHETAVAEAWLARAYEMVKGDPYRTQRITLLEAETRLHQGQIEVATARLAEIARPLDRRDQMWIVEMSTSLLSHCHLLAGRFAEARQAAEEALQTARALRGSWREAVDELRLGACDLYDNRLDAARTHLERALAWAEDAGDALTESEAMVLLGAAIGLSKDPVGGTVLCEDGFKRAVRSGQRLIEVSADLWLLRLAIERGDPGAMSAGLARCAAHGDHLTRYPLLARMLDDLRQASSRVAQAS